MSTAPNITAPLSIPLIITKYLVDALDEGDEGDAIGVKWAGRRRPKRSDDWFFATFGVALNTDEETTVEQGIERDTVDPDIIKPTHGRTIVVAQASGFSVPKWGLDYVRARVFSLVNVKSCPALEAEDMMERIKLALNSIDGREIWRMEKLPLFYPDTEKGDQVTPDKLEHAIPFNMQRWGRKVEGRDKIRILPDIYQLVPLEEDESAPKPVAEPPYNIPFEHIANWSSTVLDGNTIQQASSGEGGGRENYTAFSIDFTMYIELLHPSVLGFREPFVDRRV